MAHYKVMARIVMDSGIPEDASINTWHCDALALPNGYEDFVDDLAAFYLEIDGLYSSACATTGHTLTVYRMSDPEPRAPILTQGFSFAATATLAEPPELAVCLSFQGDRESGVSQARRRGRVYIGPLGRNHTSDTNPQFASGAVAVLATAGQNLLSLSTASINYDWVVWSAADNAMVPVTNGWVDNAYDIQRRRGLTATARDVF